MDKIKILMSAYNGEKYIREQLDSILAQTGVVTEIIIRDDCSKDNTLSIIKEYCQKYDNIKWLESEKNLGAWGSFLELLKKAEDFDKDYDYIAFADQDDFWLEEKLVSAANLMNSYVNEPCFYYSRKSIVDEQLQPLRFDGFPVENKFYEFVRTPNAYGCTIVFNKEFYKLINSYYPKCFVTHDEWLLRIAQATDTKIVFDENAYILYRQHSSNAAGIYKKRTIKERARLFFKCRNMRCVYPYAKEILEGFADKLPEKNRRSLENIVGYDKSIRAKVRIIRDKNLKSGSQKTNLRMIKSYIFNQI